MVLSVCADLPALGGRRVRLQVSLGAAASDPLVRVERVEQTPLAQTGAAAEIDRFLLYASYHCRQLQSIATNGAISAS